MLDVREELRELIREVVSRRQIVPASAFMPAIQLEPGSFWIDESPLGEPILDVEGLTQSLIDVLDGQGAPSAHRRR